MHSDGKGKKELTKNLIIFFLNIFKICLLTTYDKSLSEKALKNFEYVHLMNLQILLLPLFFVLTHPEFVVCHDLLVIFFQPIIHLHVLLIIERFPYLSKLYILNKNKLLLNITLKDVLSSLERLNEEGKA